MDNTTIGTLATAVLAPILAYLKVREDRLKTADKRDAQQMIVNKRLDDIEVQIHTVEEIKQAINELNISMARITAILEMYVKNCDRVNCPQKGP